jgi:hypothetical protein
MPVCGETRTPNVISHRFLDASTAKGMLGKKAPQRVGRQDLIGERNWGEILRSDQMKIALAWR